MKLANSVFETNSSGNVGIGTTPNGTDKLLVGGHLNVTGNLTVSGTTLTINSTTMTVDDPIITLGGDTAPVADDNKDRGVEFRWHNGSAAKVGFFGFDDSTGKFTFIPDATNTSEVFTGTKGTLDANVEWADILSKPTTISGYGITDAVTLSGTQTITGSKTFSIGPTVVTQTKGDRTTLAASTAFVDDKFRCTTTSGVLDWSDDTNTVAGSGTTLLTGSTTNGPGGAAYYYPFNLVYGTTASPNTTQLAIGYNATDLHMRYRYSSVWSNWVQFLNSANSGSIGLVNGTSSVRIPSANGPAVVTTNNIERLRVTETGLALIGTNTSIGNFPLQVVSSSNSRSILVYSSAVDSDAGVGFTNDARSWSASVRGTSADAFVIRDVTGGQDRLSVATDGTITLNGATQSYGTIANYQTASNAVQLTLRSSFPTAHPFTSLSSTGDTFARFRSFVNSGLYIDTFASGANSSTIFDCATQTPTTNGTFATFRINVKKSDGATGAASMANNEDAFAIQNNGGLKFLIKAGGTISTGGEVSPDAEAGGITTYTVGGAGINLTMKNSAVNHGMTTVAEADTYGILRKSGTTTGGLMIRGLSSGSEGLFITGQVTTPNTTTGYAPITLHASKANGTGVQTIAASETVLGIYNNSSTSIVRVMGNGDATFSGNVTAPQFISTATGDNPPFVVASTQRVTNLSVDNAGTADTLTTARTINGTSFNGSANITTAQWGTARNITIGSTAKSVNGSANVSWTLDEIGAAPNSLTMNNQTGTTYTLVLADAGKNITMNNAAANTLTIPANASVAFPVGTIIKITQLGAGQTTVNITTDTLNVAASFTTKLAEQYSEVVITKMTSTMWVISGDLEPV